MKNLYDLYQDGFISISQYHRAISFIKEVQKWMLSEQDPDHPMMKEEISIQIISNIDIYLWCIDPILLRSPDTIHNVAKIWLEKKIYKMNPDDAATFIDKWINI